jgi:hypothetical protein
LYPCNQVNWVSELHSTSSPCATYSGNGTAEAGSVKERQDGGSGREEKADDCASDKKDEDRTNKKASSVARENPLRNAVRFKRK